MSRAILALAAVAAVLPCLTALPVAPTAATSTTTVSGPPHPFEVCPGAPDHLHISSLRFEPDPIKADAELTVVVAGRVDEEVRGGTAKLSVSYYGVPVVTKEFSICEQFGVDCPEKAGSPFTGEIKYHVPPVPLSGVTLDVQIDVNDKKGLPLSCIKTQAKV